MKLVVGLLALLTLAWGRGAAGQISRLPPIGDGQDAAQPGLLLSATEPVEGLAEPPVPEPLPQANGPPKDYRNGFFQKLSFTGAWVASGGAQGLELSESEIQGIFALPCPTPQSPLLLTPGFAVRWLDGPVEPDLPARLHDAYFEFRWMSMLGERVGVDLSVRPGIYSDFQRSHDEAFRVSARALGMYQFTPNFKLVGGAAWLDRDETPLVPIAGVLWTPTPEWNFELIFPRPKIGRRIYLLGNFGELAQDWLYLLGEFGSGVWAIEQGSGASTVMEMSDARIILGAEHKAVGTPDYWFDVGYVFVREVNFQNDQPDFEPSDGLLLRAGILY